jgi:hypothetical protein
MLRIINETGIDDIVVTEYDNYIPEKAGKYTTEENLEKAKYLEDTLISLYSNTNVSEFIFWVYNSTSGNFSNEERNVYIKLINSWLHDSKSGVTNENGSYKERLHPGTYTALVKANGKTKEVKFDVNNTNTLEIILE